MKNKEKVARDKPSTQIFQHYAHIAPKLTSSHHRSAVVTACRKRKAQLPLPTQRRSLSAERVDGDFVPMASMAVSMLASDSTTNWLAAIPRIMATAATTHDRRRAPSGFFGFDSSAISGDERDPTSSQLSREPGEKLLLEGHCDWYGTAEYNLALGDRRAIGARDYLITWASRLIALKHFPRQPRSTSRLSKPIRTRSPRRRIVLKVSPYPD